jgi:hypothetical protein
MFWKHILCYVHMNKYATYVCYEAMTTYIVVRTSYAMPVLHE